MNTKTKSVLYSILAAGATAAVAAFVPEPYRTAAAGAVGLVLLNLRNAWHVPEPKADE